MEPRIDCDPSSARAHALVLHQQIRRHLRRVLDLAGRVRRDDDGRAGVALRDAMKDLTACVRRHVGSEEQWVMPVLEQLDAWGEQRKEDLHSDHQAEIEALERVDYDSALTMAEAAVPIARAILRALRHEECVVLSADLLECGPIMEQEVG